MSPAPDVRIADDGLARCGWVGDDAEYRRYHDEEWGVALHGDRALFEKLSLEAFQSGLSWITILRRREGFRHAFAGFDPETVAGFGEDDLDIEVQENVLTIAGKRTQSEDAEQRNYLHRGIAERSFERRFHLADHVQVREASLENGLLRIQLEREIPEAKKPRRIAVNGKSETKLISADKASAA